MRTGPMQPRKHTCYEGLDTCKPNNLCERCLRRELAVKRPMARALGACWAEKIARLPVHRVHPKWPVTEETLTIARTKVVTLGKDPRLLDELAASCVRGAATWWQKRPERYRSAR